VNRCPHQFTHAGGRPALLYTTRTQVPLKVPLVLVREYDQTFIDSG